jgi:hypothetical protein
MQPILKYLKAFYAGGFNWLYFVLVVLTVGTFIYLNYWHDLEKKYAYSSSSWVRSFSGYYLMYFTPFACAFLLQYFFVKDSAFFHNPWFWVILFLAPAFFSFRVNFNFHYSWMYERWEGTELKFFFTTLNWLVRVAVLFVPLLIIWFMKDRENQPFYGIKSAGNFKPYLIMLLIMIPLIAIASTQNDFLHTYPKAKILAGLPSNSFGQKMRYAFFELCYGFDFVSIEFFFRGFLILSLAKICGTNCIIPVACFYCTIHFGKPMGEAISSFFGGILLGIVCYNTKSVWGGLFVHLGIAWLMEIGGWLGNFFNNR